MFKKLRTVTIKYTSTSELNVILKHKNYDCETFFFRTYNSLTQIPSEASDEWPLGKR